MSGRKKVPQFLKAGDEVAIISPSWAIDESKIGYAVRLLESWGLKVRLGKNVLRRYGPFAGSDRERLDDLQAVTDDRNIRAVLCSRGGYGMLRIINKLNFNSLRRNPKWFVGFSDITVLNLWLSEIIGMVSIHAAMPLHYSDVKSSEETLRSLHAALFGEKMDVTWKGSFIRPAKVRGELTGGNLSLVYSLIGTKAEPGTKGKILFIEDVGEKFYHIDRMMVSLRLAGKLEKLSGLLAGGFTEMEDTKIPWGESLEDTFAQITNEYSFPVFCDFPAGHQHDNRALYIGKMAEVSIAGNEATLKYL